MRRLILFLTAFLIFTCSKNITKPDEGPQEPKYFDFYTSLTPDTSGIYCEIHIVYPNQDSIIIYNIYGGDSYHGKFVNTKKKCLSESGEGEVKFL